VNSPTNHTVYELLVNDDFINYVIQPTLIIREMWEKFFDSHPEIIPAAIEAKKILLGEAITHTLSANEYSELEKQLFEKCGISVA
jgi:hypothetical protein